MVVYNICKIDLGSNPGSATKELNYSVTKVPHNNSYLTS